MWWQKHASLKMKNTDTRGGGLAIVDIHLPTELPPFILLSPDTQPIYLTTSRVLTESTRGSESIGGRPVRGSLSGWRLKDPNLYILPSRNCPALFCYMYSRTLHMVTYSTLFRYDLPIKVYNLPGIKKSLCYKKWFSAGYKNPWHSELELIRLNISWKKDYQLTNSLSVRHLTLNNNKPSINPYKVWYSHQSIP